jgi:hypothetical protein
LSDYATQETYPMRSPLVVADYLLSKTPAGDRYRFGEIGSGSGDVIDCMCRCLSTSLLSVEMMPSICNRLRRRGIDVACQPFYRWVKSNASLLAAQVDVWYWWVFPPLRTEEFLRELGAVYEKSGRRGVAFVGYDSHVPEDMAALPLLLLAYDGTVERLFFDEGGALDSETEPSIFGPNYTDLVAGASST